MTRKELYDEIIGWVIENHSHNEHVMKWIDALEDIPTKHISDYEQLLERNMRQGKEIGYNKGIKEAIEVCEEESDNK